MKSPFKKHQQLKNKIFTLTKQLRSGVIHLRLWN